MEMNKYQNHPLYIKEKRKFYFDRWKWVIWNAFITLCLFARLKQNYILIDFILFCLTFVATVFLLAVMPKTKFENSRECQDIKDLIDDI